MDECSDKTVEAVSKICFFAEENGSDVDRIEVRVGDRNGELTVQFVGHLKPKALAQTTCAIGYVVAKG